MPVVTRHDDYDEDEQYPDYDDRPPERDARGRFKKGSTGNRYGRPRKRPMLRPDGLAGGIAKALLQPITVRQRGRHVTMTALDILAEKLVADAINGSPSDRARVLRLFAATKQDLALRGIADWREDYDLEEQREQDRILKISQELLERYRAEGLVD